MSAPLGRRRGSAGATAAAVALAAGAVAIAIALGSGRAGAALAVLDAGWLFWAGIAAGGVALSAAVRLASGGWAEPLLPHAEAASGFLLPALVPLGLLVLDSRGWMPGRPSPVAARALCDLGGALALSLAGRAYLARAGRGAAAPAWAVAYLLLYAAVLSCWAIDLVLALGPWAASTVIPAYYFMTALLAALCWATLRLLSQPGPGDPAVRHDAGKLVFGLVCFWGYLLFAEFLPTWYENLPDETGFLLARWHGLYRPMTGAVLAAVGLVPLAVLLTEWAKRRRAWLGLAAVSVLLGTLGECLLLVLPPLGHPADPANLAIGAAVFAGLTGLFLLTTGGRRGASARSSSNA
ncbi:MAG: hypothetical protein ACYDCL_10430 [Myxococcales bacterium]